jgi:hypothetical protein
MHWDIFISYAREDKDTIAWPLARALQAAHVRVWLDENELTLEDSLQIERTGCRTFPPNGTVLGVLRAGIGTKRQTVSPDSRKHAVQLKQRLFARSTKRWSTGLR